MANVGRLSMRLLLSKAFREEGYVQHRRLLSHLRRSSPRQERVVFQKQMFSKTCIHQFKCESTNAPMSHAAGLRNVRIVQYKLADIGEGIRDVTLKEWFKNVGDRIEQFEDLCEVQSDKASVSITSRYDGVIKKLHFEVDDNVLVGQALVDIELLDLPSTEDELSKVTASEPTSVSSGEDTVASEASSETASEAIPASEEAASIEQSTVNEIRDVSVEAARFKCLASPVVRRLASDNNIDLTGVLGTGPNGRILKGDVLAYMKKFNKAPESSQISEPEQVEEISRKDCPLTSKTVPVSGVRKAMAKAMTKANTVPHFGYCDKIDVTELVKLKAVLKEIAAKKGIKLSYMPIFIKAASMSLLQYPILNATVDENCDNITYQAAHNIGFAMDTAQGLIVPNIKNVQNLSVMDLAVEMNRITTLGHKGKLGLKDLSGGTFTLSNIGMIGGTYFSPIIFVPEVAVGAIGSIEMVRRLDAENQVEVAHLLRVSWSADHRVIDGATMARFSNLWKSYLQNPASLILDLV